MELVRARANSEHRIERIKDTPVLRLRNKLLPLMHLKKLLKLDDGASSDPENGFIVVTQVGSQTFGIVVDGVFHTEEIVVKPMSTKLRHIGMFSIRTASPSRSAPPQPRRMRSRTKPRPPAPATRSLPRCWCSAPARRSPRRCRSRW